MSVLFLVCLIVGALSHVFGALFVIFHRRRDLFACCRGLFVSLTIPMCALSRSRFSVALAVLGVSLWRARSGSVRDLRCPCPPWRPTCLWSLEGWSCDNWVFDWQMSTLRESLDSDLGAYSSRSDGDVVEYYQRLLMLTAICGRKRRVEVGK